VPCQRDRSQGRGHRPQVTGEASDTHSHVQNGSLAGRQWLTTVILATQEAEIRRIMVCGLKPAWANSLWDPISEKKKSQKKGW
jgi:hypothetical protein